MKSEFTRALEISAKTGYNVDKLIEAIIREVPPPRTLPILFNHPINKLQTKIQKQREALLKKYASSPPSRAYIFDSWFEENVGVHFVVRMLNGSIRADDVLFMPAFPETTLEVKQVGVFNPNYSPQPSLEEGCVGFIATGLKDSKFGIQSLGQTICSLHKDIEPLPKAERQQALVYASVFPDQPDQFEDFYKSVLKIQLEDPAIEVELEACKALGNGIRAGFLGELHLDVFRQRLLDEFNLSTICTPPSVTYKIRTSKGETLNVRNATDITDNLNDRVTEYQELYVKVNVIARGEDSPTIYELFDSRRGKVTEVNQISKHQVKITAEAPLGELIEDFNKELKIQTRGFGSYDFEPLEWRPTQVVLLKITIMDEEVDAFKFLVHKSKAQDLGKKICQAFADHIPAQMFTCHVRAVIGGRVIAKEEIKAHRKDVTAKCYGGDYSRKKKLLERQKEGKARMREVGKVQMSAESLNKIYKSISK